MKDKMKTKRASKSMSQQRPKAKPSKCKAGASYTGK